MFKKKQQPELTPEQQRAADIAEKKKDLLLQAIRADDKPRKNRKFLKPIVIVVAVICAVLIFLLATFGFVGNTWFAKVNLEDDHFDTSTYTDEQKQQAADAVISYFGKNFNGSILFEVNYSEKWSRERDAVCFTGKFYSIFSNNDKVENTTMVNDTKWHWDVTPADGGYEVKTYGFLKDVVDTTQTQPAEE